MAILVAIDENERSKRVVEIGYDLAQAYDDTLVALHVVPREDFKEHAKSVKDIPVLQDYSITQEAESAAGFARKFVEKTIEDIDQNKLDARGRVGDITDEILSEASEVEPRYLVISGRRRSPTGKAVFGNTTQQILLNSEHPVMTQLSDD